MKNEETPELALWAHAPRKGHERTQGEGGRLQAEKKAFAKTWSFGLRLLVSRTVRR